MAGCCGRGVGVSMIGGLVGAIMGSAAAVASDLAVVVTSKPIHSLVAAVMEGASSPRLLIQGNASPHTYALKPSDAKALNDADVVFRVSEDLEPFTTRIFASLPKKVGVVSLAETPGLVRLALREGGAFEAHMHASHGHEAKHAHEAKPHMHATDGTNSGAPDDVDPHVWLDPGNARKIVAHVAEILAARSPTDAAIFKANAVRLDGRLAALDGELERGLKQLGNKPFVVFHDSLQYLEARYGLAAVGTITVKPEQQPSARRLSDLRRKIVGLGTVCVFAEPQYPGKLVDSITEGTKARTAVVDPEGGLLEPGPELYFELMRRAAAALRACLAQS